MSRKSVGPRRARPEWAAPRARKRRGGSPGPFHLHRAQGPGGPLGLADRGPAREPGLRDRMRAHVRWGRLPLLVVRLLVMGGAAAAVTWGVVGSWGVAAAVVGAVLGAVLGHVLALTRTRLPVLLLGAAGLAALGVWLGHAVVSNASMVDALGLGTAMRTATMLRFGAGAAALAGLLRLLAVRMPSLVGLELLAVVLAVVLPLSPHRDGVVARPLWLSDWAFEMDLDPAHVLLAIGGGLSLVLGGLLMARPDRRVSLPSWAALVGLLLLGVSMLDVTGLPQPEAGNDLGLTGNERGDDPLPTDPGNWPGGSAGGEGGGGGGGGKPEKPDGKGGGGKPEQTDGKGGGKPEQTDGKGGKPEQTDGKGGKPQEGKGGGGKPEQTDGKGGKPQESKGGGGQPPPKPPQLDEDSPPPSGGAPAPMAVVLFGDDYEPPSGGFYFRQDAWSHWNGSRLVDSRRPDVDRDVPKTFPVTSTEVAAPPPEDGRQAVSGLVFLAVKHTRPFALESPVALRPEKNPEPNRFVRAYGFDSRAQTIEYAALLGRATHDPAWAPEVRDYYVRMPDDPRYAELAAQIVATLPPERQGDPFAQALTIKLWLDEQITYSTSERHAGASDPTADFLFGSRIGYCVHIAHAAALLWRARGIAARVGTGYRGTPDDLRGSALVLRGSDAHAWPELHLEGVGWIVLDVAPQKTLDPPAEPADDELTQQLAELARADPGQAQQAQAEEPRATEARPSLPWILLAWLAVTLVVLYVVKLWRRLAPWWVRGPKLPRVAWRRALDQLAEVGLVRHLGETRTAFAVRAQTVAPSLHALAALSEAAQLGNPAADPRARPELWFPAWKQALRTLALDLRAHVPARRRVLGLLNPLAFWSAR
jgi:transglutaminase-like putative cysteine protease